MTPSYNVELASTLRSGAAAQQEHGLLTEQIGEHALALVHPSYFESFAMVLTESFAQRRPALVQRRCAVLEGHAQRSGGALPYSGFAEFEAVVDELHAAPELADALGAAGRRYVEQDYDWDVVMARYERTLEQVAGRD